MFFRSVSEAILAYENGYITLHSQIKVRVSKTMPDGTVKTGTIDATLGRLPSSTRSFLRILVSSTEKFLAMN